MRWIHKTIAVMMILLTLTACAAPAQQESAAPAEPEQETVPVVETTPAEEPAEAPAEVPAEEPAVEEVSMEEIYVEQHTIAEVELHEEVVALSEAPAAVFTMLTAEASGTAVKENGEAVIDYSNVEDGYVMVKYTAATDKRLKARVQGPTTTYTYNLKQGNWEVFPLSDGNGSYKVTVYRNAYDTKYAQVLSTSFSVKLKDEFGPFLRPNQYVDFSNSPKTIKKAAALMKNLSDPLTKVAAVYDYVVDTLSYDYDKAATVTSGYLPVLDTVLAARKGICFDYASLMAGMLRSQGVPCKLVVGYAGSAFHAWISVWTEGEGWVDGVIFFNGTTWHRMDPTFASSSNRSSDVMSFISNDSNYSTKYIY